MRTDWKRNASVGKEHFTDRACICSRHAETHLFLIYVVLVCVSKLTSVRQGLETANHVGTWSEFCENFRSCWHFHIELLYRCYGLLCEAGLNTLFRFIWCICKINHLTQLIVGILRCYKLGYTVSTLTGSSQADIKNFESKLRNFVLHVIPSGINNQIS
jgi:hypothetical protein